MISLNCSATTGASSVLRTPDQSWMDRSMIKSSELIFFIDRLPRLSPQAGFDYDKDNIVVTCTVVDNSARRHISSGICDY